MIPETYIINAISNTWIEKFPENDTTSFPKGLVKRISMNPTKTKDNIVSGQYNSRISVIWYDVNTILFDSKMVSIINSVDGINGNAEILNVEYDNRTDGYDDTTDMHVMSLDFLIKHTL